MISAHGPSVQDGVHGDLVLATISLCVIAATYVVAAILRARENRGWNHWRTASFVVGIAILMIAVRPSVSDSFGDHMLGHLLIGMFAPLALVLAAPMTLVLRSVSPGRGRTLIHLLRSKPVGVLTNPIFLLAATLGGLALLYFTPLFEIADSHPALHGLIHLHFFVTGYAFAWMIAGPDPAPTDPRSVCDWWSSVSPSPDTLSSRNCSMPASSCRYPRRPTSCATGERSCTTGATPQKSSSPSHCSSPGSPITGR